MRFFLTILSSLVAAELISAQIPILGEYNELWNTCVNGGPDSYVGVKYENGFTTTFKFGECYPYSVGGSLAQMAVFCKAATCYNNPNIDCTGGAVPPVPVPIVAGLVLPNVADWVQLLGQGATCQKNGLS